MVAFDFSGSGLSEGDWVTLGYFEQHDVADVLAYLRSNGESSDVEAWRRAAPIPRRCDKKPARTQRKSTVAVNDEHEAGVGRVRLPVPSAPCVECFFRGYGRSPQ